MIARKLLPAYYQACGRDVIFKVLRSITVNGHESAWMEIKDKRESNPHRDFLCQCYFTEGLGWKSGRGGSHDCTNVIQACLPRQAAAYLRRLELQEEYRNRFPNANPRGGRSLNRDLGGVILDLLDKSVAGEFLGHPFHNHTTSPGYLLVHTVQLLTGVDGDRIQEVAWHLYDKRQLNLSNGVVTPPLGSSRRHVA